MRNCSLHFVQTFLFLYTRLLIYIHWSILHKVEKPLSRGEGKQEIRLHYVVYRTLNPFELMRHTWDLIFANSYIKLHLPSIDCFINMLNYYKTRLYKYLFILGFDIYIYIYISLIILPVKIWLSIFSIALWGMKHLITMHSHQNSSFCTLTSLYGEIKRCIQK